MARRRRWRRRVAWAMGITLFIVSCGQPAPMGIKLVNPGILAAFGPGSSFLVPPPPAFVDPWAIGSPGAASADGRWVAYETFGKGTPDIWLIDVLSGAIDPLPNLNSSAAEVRPSVSPDGRWITFSSNRNGSWDLFQYDRVSQAFRPLTFFSAPGPAIAAGMPWPAPFW